MPIEYELLIYQKTEKRLNTSFIIVAATNTPVELAKQYLNNSTAATTVVLGILGFQGQKLVSLDLNKTEVEKAYQRLIPQYLPYPDFDPILNTINHRVFGTQESLSVQKVRAELSRLLEKNVTEVSDPIAFAQMVIRVLSST